MPAKRRMPTIEIHKVNGCFFYVVKSANNRVFATSKLYDNLAIARQAAIDLVQICCHMKKKEIDKAMTFKMGQ